MPNSGFARTDRLRFASALDKDELFGHVREASYGYRLAGSEDEARVFDYVGNVVTDLGFKVYRETPVNLVGMPGAAELEIVGPEPYSLAAYGYSMSPPTPTEGVVGELCDIGNGMETDYPPESVAGRILLSTGIAMPAKVVQADRSAALAHIHIGGERHHEMCISPVWGSPTPETYGRLPRTPSIAVTSADGARLRESLAAGPVHVRVKTTSDRSWKPIPVLTAQLDGTDSELFTLFSAHIDSWHAGAMDNATGNAVQLGVAKLLAAQRGELRRGIRLAFWSGHSHGRYAGSTWYADHHWQDLYDNCACYINADSVGAFGADDLSDGPTMAETYEFTAAVVEEITGQRLGYRRIPRSSEESFLGLGISATLSTLSEQTSSGATVAAARALMGTNSAKRGGGFGWWWHTTEDTLDKVDPVRLRRDAEIYAAMIWDLCTLPTFPFNFSATAREIGENLGKLQHAAGTHFDLSGLISQADRLESTLESFVQVRHDKQLVDRTLVGLGRALIPATFTNGGAFEQDPALGLPPLPGLAGVAQLAALPSQSPERYALEVKLVRERNRLGAALVAAERLVQAASRAR